MIIFFNMKISVIIPNYNGEALLLKNIPKVIDELDSYSEEIEVIVVDDASVDGSIGVLEQLEQKYKNLMHLKNEKNLGFSSTVNKGVRNAKGDIVLLLNTDVYPQRGFLIPLIENFDDNRVFAVGCMDKSIEGEKTILRGRGLGSWARGFLIHRRGEVDKKNTLWVSGGSSAFRKGIWEKLGGLNELYNPFYWEDIDLSYRAQKSGYIVLFEPRSIVYHEHEKGSIKSSYSPFKIKTISYRNQFIFIWANITDMDLILSHLFFMPYHVFKSFINFDLAFLIGFFKALIMSTKVIEFRLKASKLFVKSDKLVINS